MLALWQQMFTMIFKMGYLERDTVPYRDPHPPSVSDEEAQQLRDLWRPGVQETWQPHIWRDGDTGELRQRVEDFDTTKASLWMDYPMYVIPPVIAEPLTEQLAEQVDGPMFRTSPDWERSVLHGARRFMRRFLWAVRGGQFLDYSRGKADANFDHLGKPTGHLAAGSDRYPHVSVPAPLLERKIDHKEGVVGRIIDTPEDYGSLIFTEGRTERQQREGILGWTVPFTHKETNFFAHSILRAKNHLIDFRALLLGGIAMFAEQLGGDMESIKTADDIPITEAISQDSSQVLIHVLCGLSSEVTKQATSAFLTVDSNKRALKRLTMLGGAGLATAGIVLGINGAFHGEVSDLGVGAAMTYSGVYSYLARRSIRQYLRVADSRSRILDITASDYANRVAEDIHQTYCTAHFDQQAEESMLGRD